MAIINRDNFFSQLEAGARWNAGVSFYRTNPLPLDDKSVFESLQDAQTYAQSATAYPGQIIAVIGQDGTNSYYGISQTGTLEELGGAVDVDDKTIAYGTDGTLSLKNFGVKYYRYVPGAGDSDPGEFVETDWNDKTNPASNLTGLEVKVVKLTEGTFELAFYQPNPTTVEGLQSAISDLQTTVSNMYTKADIDDKLAEIPTWVALD